MSALTDRPIYLIHLDFGAAGSAIIETDPASLDCTDRDRVIAAIITGEFDHRVNAVWLADFAAGRLTDISRNIAAEVRARIIAAGEGADDAIETVEFILGCDLRGELAMIAEEEAADKSDADEHSLGARELGIGSRPAIWG